VERNREAGQNPPRVVAPSEEEEEEAEEEEDIIKFVAIYCSAFKMTWFQLSDALWMILIAPVGFV
jgi:hypothetical protein